MATVAEPLRGGGGGGFEEEEEEEEEEGRAHEGFQQRRRQGSSDPLGEVAELRGAAGLPGPPPGRADPRARR